MTSNQLAYQRNLIQGRELEETQRSNLVNEAIKQMTANASQKQADAALTNALVNEYLKRYNAEALASRSTRDTIEGYIAEKQSDYTKAKEQSEIWKNWLSGLAGILRGVAAF